MKQLFASQITQWEAKKHVLLRLIFFPFCLITGFGTPLFLLKNNFIGYSDQSQAKRLLMRF